MLYASENIYSENKKDKRNWSRISFFFYQHFIPFLIPHIFSIFYTYPHYPHRYAHSISYSDVDFFVYKLFYIILLFFYQKSYIFL